MGVAMCIGCGEMRLDILPHPRGQFERQEIVDNPDRRNPRCKGWRPRHIRIPDRAVLATICFSCLLATCVNPGKSGYPSTVTGTGKAGILDVYYLSDRDRSADQLNEG